MKLLNDISFVKRAKNRLKVFKEIEGTLMPSELVIKIYGKNSNTYFNIVSRALSELAGKNLVKVLNPKIKTGRFYTLTKKGKIILEKLNELKS
mgnify:CR=1 FL=1|jgi:predicted transcriptional regulator|tara:strand:+ start:2887 stop:3165 length:279 start_codon:yes stop_codon:yes gene_type:complete